VQTANFEGIHYVRAGQLQPTGSPHNLSRTCLMAARVYTYIAKEGMESTRRSLFYYKSGWMGRQ